MDNNQPQKELTLVDIAELIRVSADETRNLLEAKIISSVKASETALEAKMISSIKASKTALEAKMISSIKASETALGAKIDSSAAELAAMTQNDLLRLESKITDLGTEIKEVNLNIEEIKANLNKKVNVIDNNTLIYRVEKLEKKFA